MSIERILKQIEDYEKEDHKKDKETRKLIKKYLSIPLTLPITDKSMRRVCEVLTRVGYETFESCEGHGQAVPKIFLKGGSPYYLRHLTQILIYEHNTYFPWDLRTWNSDIFLNQEKPLIYILMPDLSLTTSSPKNPQDYEEMIDDLDRIGISVLDYFSSVNLKNFEKYRKEADNQVRKFKIPLLPDDFFRK